MSRRIFISCFLLLTSGAQAGETSLGVFVEATEGSEPALAIEPQYSLKGNVEGIKVEFDSKASLEFVAAGDHFNDALIDLQANAMVTLSPRVSLAADAAHVLDRDYDETFSPDFAAIDTKHSISGSLSLETSLDVMRITLDAGASTTLHQDLQRIGISDFDRSAQDYVQPEFAAHLTLLTDKEINPFVEVAYAGRHYFETRDIQGSRRDFAGPEFIAGFEIESATLSGQVAAILAWRNHAEDGVERQLILGPYVDLTWHLNAESEFIFAAASSLAQESNGAVSVHPVHAMHIEAKTAPSDAVELGSTIDFKYEDFAGRGGTLTIAPEVSVTWSPQKNISLIAGAGGEWTKESGAAGTFEASAKAGVKFGLN